MGCTAIEVAIGQYVRKGTFRHIIITLGQKVNTGKPFITLYITKKLWIQHGLKMYPKKVKST